MKSILVVDDFASLRDYLTVVLSEEGYTVYEADGPKTAQQVLKTTAIDLLITDIVMPEKDGIELLMYIRTNFPGLKCLAISGATHNDVYLASARKIGAHATLTKPFDHTTLLTTVKRLLSEDVPVIF